MYGNIMIILISLVIIFISIKIFIAGKRRHIGYKVTSIILMSIVAMTVIIPNIAWIKSPYTKVTCLKIIDEETMKPISKVNVVVSWDIVWGYFPGTVMPKYDESELKITDESGVVNVNSRLKPLSLMVLPLIGRNGYEINAFLFVDNYRCKFVGASKDDTVYMSRIHNYTECMKNRENIKSHLSIYIADYNKKARDFVNNYLVKTTEYCSNYVGGK